MKSRNIPIGNIMKYTLITGASAGIGKSTAFKFAKEGHNLILAARREELLNSIKNELISRYGIEAIVKSVDLSENSEVTNFYEEVKQYEIDVFINNAAFGDFNKVWDIDVEKAGKMIDLNVRALTTLSLLYVQDYKDKDATLINISSRAGYSIYQNVVTYCATKFYVSAFTEGIAQNLRDGGYRMRAKLLAPGQVHSEFVKSAVKDTDVEEFEWNDAHTSDEMAEYAYELYKSDQVVSKREQNGIKMMLQGPVFKYF